MKAIIAGTGIDRLLEGFDTASVKTRYGVVDVFTKGDVVILPRHKADHSIAPGRIDYKANIQALADLGVSDAIGIYAVGSITSRLSPGSFGVVEDFIDISGRDLTFHDGIENPLRHVGMVNCFDRQLASSFARSAYMAGEKEIRAGIVYIMTNGPRLETPAEIRAFRNLGAAVVGMSLASEAVLLRELGIRHVAIAYSINWAAGLDEEGVSFLEDESIRRLSSRLLDISLAALS